jgi:hypothetical protein
MRFLPAILSAAVLSMGAFAQQRYDPVIKAGEAIDLHRMMSSADLLRFSNFDTPNQAIGSLVRRNNYRLAG